MKPSLQPQQYGNRGGSGQREASGLTGLTEDAFAPWLSTTCADSIDGRCRPRGHDDHTRVARR